MFLRERDLEYNPFKQVQMRKNNKENSLGKKTRTINIKMSMTCLEGGKKYIILVYW